jgi:hypothetical protein
MAHRQAAQVANLDRPVANSCSVPVRRRGGDAAHPETGIEPTPNPGRASHMAVAIPGSWPIGPSPKLISHDMEAADATNFAGGTVPVPTRNLVAILRMPASPLLEGLAEPGPPLGRLVASSANPTTTKLTIDSPAKRQCWRVIGGDSATALSNAPVVFRVAFDRSGGGYNRGFKSGGPLHRGTHYR